MATINSKNILEYALNLPPIERAQLVDKLLMSFDDSEKLKYDVLWADEAESRIDAYEQGVMKSKPAHKVFDEIDRRKKK